mgnify:CR=1 FL=1
MANLRQWIVVVAALSRVLLGGPVGPTAPPSSLVQTRDPKAEVGWVLQRLIGKRRATLRPLILRGKRHG